MKDYQIAVSFELPKYILLAKFKAYFHSQGNPMPPCLTFKEQEVKLRELPVKAVLVALH